MINYHYLQLNMICSDKSLIKLMYLDYVDYVIMDICVDLIEVLID